MRGLLQLYVQQFKTTFASQIQYRAALVIWLISDILEPVIYLVVWSVVAQSQGGSVGGFTAPAFAAYYIILMLVNHATYTWIMYEFEYRVRQGGLSFLLLRPVHPIHADISDNLSAKLITSPGLLLVALILSGLFHPSWHPAVWSLAAAVPALALAFIIRFLIEWSLALCAFWTTRVGALNQAYFVGMLFLSGQMAPIALLPGWVQTVTALLPFRWMISFPLQLILGQLSPAEAWAGFGAQAIWALLALAIVRFGWRAGVRTYSAVGG
jgi:viologen exporter family transport system permease protein